jgi:ABC-type phosphate/phosphonate transport system substrate-binding protein
MENAMKKTVQILLAMIACNMFVACCCSKKEEAPKPVVAPVIQDPADDTDVFAIPLDSSEEEDEAEIKKLESLEKKPAADTTGATEQKNT